MEEKNNIALKHRAHEHWLILNENYIAKEGDVCVGCREQIVSCKSFVYSCSNITTTASTSEVENLCLKFLLHKTCAELPRWIFNPTDQEDALFFIFNLYLSVGELCNECSLTYRGFSYLSFKGSIFVCFKCALVKVQQSKEDPEFVHPGHDHPLALLQDPSSFKCYACRVDDNIRDMSYRCTKCQFWMHKTCHDAPASFLFQFHEKHPLVLSFSLPQVYRKFDQHCRLCNEKLGWKEWLYCCHSCRFFTHFRCARSRTLLSSSEDDTYSNVVHLPATDELSLNLLLEQFVGDFITPDESNSQNNQIKHWSHDEHVLKLITSNELYERKRDDGMLLCEGCVKPIRTNDHLSYYGCVPCKYFMHKACAELPREIEHHLWPGKTLFANKYSQPFEFFMCKGCEYPCNAIFYSDSMTPSGYNPRLHTGCVTLPKIIKHEAHLHNLNQVYDSCPCNACGWKYSQCVYRCEKCNYNICVNCTRHARTYKHRWDPHPLDLIYDAGMVEEHEHDFNCEHCSDDIDTNEWFYHCGKCDLSFHLHCIGESSFHRFQYMKFGANTMRDELHSHQLTFVLNKKVGRCEKCGSRSRVMGEPVLRCVPCNTMFCQLCWK